VNSKCEEVRKIRPPQWHCSFNYFIYEYVTVLPLMCKQGLVEPDFYETWYRILVPELSGKTRFLLYMKI